MTVLALDFEENTGTPSFALTSDWMRQVIAAAGLVVYSCYLQSRDEVSVNVVGCLSNRSTILSV